MKTRLAISQATQQTISILDRAAVMIGQALEKCPDDGSGLRPRIEQLSRDADALCGEIEEGRFTC